MMITIEIAHVRGSVNDGRDRWNNAYRKVPQLAGVVIIDVSFRAVVALI
jgi:hypothetical protein